MKRPFTAWLALPFWASPNSSIFDLMVRSSDFSAVRKARSLEPVFPGDDPIPEPPIRPVRPLPTDVPAPDSNDIPVREPMDVPLPDPGRNPKPIRPLPQRPDPKRRPTP